MKRSEFITTCGKSCLILTLVGPFMGCSPHVTIRRYVSNNQIRLVPEIFLKSNGIDYHRYVIVEVDGMDYPIVVYRHDEKTFQSLLLKCTHQGTQLNVYGDLISCSAHGSEFTRQGKVVNGPATEALQAFATVVVGDEIIIKLT